MIRLGSLAGYPFEGPRVLGGWTPPASPAVYAIMYKPDPEAKPETYAVIYVGHADDLTTERFPFNHPRAPCWIERAGSRWRVYICTYVVPGGLPLAPGADRPGTGRDLPSELQRAAVRPVLAGRVDRRVPGTDRRPAHHRANPGEPTDR